MHDINHYYCKVPVNSKSVKSSLQAIVRLITQSEHFTSVGMEAKIFKTHRYVRGATHNHLAFSFSWMASF